MKSEKHILIVGQGLAGLVLALTVKQSGHRVTVVGEDSAMSASRVSQGMLSPISGLRLNLTWGVNDAFPFAVKFYQHWAKLWRCPSLLREIRCLRVFRHSQQQRFFNKNLEKDCYRHWVEETFMPSTHPWIDNSWGSFSHSGYQLAVNTFLLFAQQELEKQGQMIVEALNYKDLCIRDDHVWWQGQCYSHVIFCEGARLVNNPWFGHLPLSLIKGEVLESRMQSDKAKPTDFDVIHGEHWLMQQAQASRLSIGATYERTYHDLNPSRQAQEKLLDYANNLQTHWTKITTTKQQVGVRPCSIDQRPLLGVHPRLRQLWVLNGFGSKGSAWIPLMAKQLENCLDKGKPLPQEVDIQRFQGQWQT